MRKTLYPMSSCAAHFEFIALRVARCACRAEQDRKTQERSARSRHRGYEVVSEVPEIRGSAEIASLRWARLR